MYSISQLCVCSLYIQVTHARTCHMHSLDVKQCIARYVWIHVLYVPYSFRADNGNLWLLALIWPTEVPIQPTEGSGEALPPMCWWFKILCDTSMFEPERDTFMPCVRLSADVLHGMHVHTRAGFIPHVCIDVLLKIGISTVSAFMSQALACLSACILT